MNQPGFGAYDLWTILIYSGHEDRGFRVKAIIASGFHADGLLTGAIAPRQSNDSVEGACPKLSFLTGIANSRNKPHLALKIGATNF